MKRLNQMNELLDPAVMAREDIIFGRLFFNDGGEPGGGGGDDAHFLDGFSGEGSTLSEEQTATMTSLRESLGEVNTIEALTARLAGPEVPDAYTIDEGVTVDQTLIDSFAPMAKEMGLTQDTYGKLIGFHNEQVKGWVENLPELVKNEDINKMLVEARGKEFDTEHDALKSSMGEEKYNAMESGAKLVIDKFASDGLKAWLNTTGLGDAPELMQLLSTFSKYAKEDSPNGGGQGGGKKEVTLAQALYPKQGQK